MENGEAPQEEGQNSEAAKSTTERFLSDVLADETLIHDWERQKIIKYLNELEINLLHNENRYKVLSIIIAFLAMFLLFFDNLINILGHYLNFIDFVFFDRVAALIYIFILINILISFFVVIVSYIQSQKVKSEIVIANRRLSELNQAKPVSPSSAGQSTVTNATIMPISETSMYFRDLLKINLRNLGDYYDLIKMHTHKSFYIARVSGILGFILITLGLSAGYFSPDNKIAYLSAAAGLITEFISGIFFYLYNRTIRELKGYHDSLLDVQNVIVSYKLIDDIQDSVAKNQAIDKMINALINKK